MERIIEERRKQVLVMLDEAYTCRVNDLKRSNALAKKALVQSNKLKDFWLVGKCLNQLALIAMIRGEHNRVIKLSHEAIRFLKQFDDDIGIADAKYNMAGVHYKTNNYHLGLVNLIDCLAIYKANKEYHKKARVYKSMGTIYEYLGDEKNAILSYKQAIAMAKKVGDLNLKTNAYNPLSGIYLKQNKVEKAMEMITRSCVIKEQTGDIRGLAFAIYGRGKVYAKTGQYHLAEQDFLRAMAIHEDAGDRLGMAMVYNKLARLYVQMNAYDRAEEMVEKAIDFSTRYNIVFIKFKCYYLLYEISKKKGKTDDALRYLELYIREKELVINTQSLKIIESYDLIIKVREMEQEAIKEREKAEIMEKKNRAEHAVAIKQEFLSTMSHEIRTPLNAVITIASLLGTRADKEEQELVDSLKFAGENLLMIINDILDFTKLESGKAVLECVSQELLPLLDNLRNTYKGLAKEKGLTLTLNIDKRLEKYYELDKTKLLQILGNLVSNAIKFTDSGGVEISVEKVSVHQDGDLLRFMVKDSGQGIQPLHQEQIFESFFQPFTITTRKQGGSGLGLAIVKRLVELHNSHIYLESEPGHGSSFYFDVIFKKAAPLQATDVAETKVLEGKKVLLAEDNTINAMVAMKLLSGWGMSTVHVKNGMEAIERSKAEVFDYILMDIHMPEMDGFTAAKQIRKLRNPNRNTPVFALTADITANHKEQYSGFFNGFLRKPIEINILRHKLMRAQLQKKSGRKHPLL
jgi:signal transduction histidine kinase/ActR/RegA family two-component response regulator